MTSFNTKGQRVKEYQQSNFGPLIPRPFVLELMFALHCPMFLFLTLHSGDRQNSHQKKFRADSNKGESSATSSHEIQ
jgi:hypothetical protein